jgi:hypothetical protein
MPINDKNQNWFVITTNYETALKIEKTFNILGAGFANNKRTISLRTINHYKGYSDVVIDIKSDATGDDVLRDTFFLGVHSH